MSRYPKFFEYMNAKGGTDEKAKVDVSGDQIDMPTPKAKDDPHKKNKKNSKSPQVKEYLNASGNLVEKPLVDIKSDYKGPDPSSPPGKNSTPYRATNSSGSKGNSEGGLGDMGYKNLKYNPNTNTETGDKTISSWPKTKTEHFIAETKDMSIAEFSQHMIENHGCKHVDFIQAIKYVVELANNNDSLMGNFVHEVKNTGGMGKLVRTILTQPEAFEELTELFGEKRAKSLRRTMNKSILEGVSPPIGLGEPSDEGKPDDMKDMEMSDMDDGFEDEEEGIEDEPKTCPHCGKDINEPPEEGGDLPDEEMDLGDEDFEDEEDLDDEDDEFGLDDEDDEDDDEFGLDDEDDEDEVPQRKKKFGDMLGGAMSGIGGM